MHEYDIISKGVAVDRASSAIILIHGRGGSPHDIMGLSDYLVDEQWAVLAPRATGHTWYPHSFMAPEESNAPYLESAVQVVQRLIEETAKHIPTENIVIAGFSQGACLASEVVARNAQRFRAVVLLTGGLIGEKFNPNKYSGDFLNTPVYMSNGSHDPHVPLERSKDTKLLLEKLGAQVTFDIFEGRPHTVSLEELNNARRIISHPTPPTTRKSILEE